MQISITHEELENYIRIHCKVKTEIGFIDEKTLCFSYKPVFILPSVDIKVSIESIVNTNVILLYHGNFAVETIIKGVILFIKGKLDNNFIHFEKQNRIVIHLSNTEKLKKMLDYLRLTDISFDKENAYLSFQIQ
jgi:hypothetical protein